MDEANVETHGFGEAPAVPVYAFTIIRALAVNSTHSLGFLWATDPLQQGASNDVSDTI
jgi:hypothetical protein